jgi:uncharacterized damage-inducible protein DinB
MTKDQIIEDFRTTFSALENVINLFNDANFNEVPFENSWTAAEVVQHIILASQNFSSVLNGTTEETKRAVDKLIPELKRIFLNFETKMKSPDFIKPVAKSYDRNELLTRIRNISADILSTIEKVELSPTCLDFQLPSIGFLTRLEAIYFVIVHTQRHTHQLQEIKRFLK